MTSRTVTPETEEQPIENITADGWIDVSRPLGPATPVWPGDRVVELTRSRSGEVLVSALATTCHVGTHLDAPLHLVANGASVNEISLDRLIGPAEVVQLPAGCGAATPEDLRQEWVPGCSRVLFRTDSHPVGTAVTDGFVALSEVLVHWLADRGVCTVGIDTPSVDVFKSTSLEAHHALIARGLTWIEGLCLKGVAPGRYLLLALPMPLVGVEAAPVRALLRPLSEAGG